MECLVLCLNVEGDLFEKKQKHRVAYVVWLLPRCHGNSLTIAGGRLNCFTGLLQSSAAQAGGLLLPWKPKTAQACLERAKLPGAMKLTFYASFLCA